MNRSSAALALSFLAGLPLTLSAQVDEEDLLPTAPFALGAAASDESALVAAADATGVVHFPRAVVHAPAQDQDQPQDQPQDKAEDAARDVLQTPPEGRRLRTWELPAVEVVGSGLVEEERVGAYEQPRWTVERLFPTTRIYVLPEGAIHGEYWMRVEEPHHGETRIRNYYEIEFGLPNRFQLDLYMVADHTGENEPFAINQQMIEGRYAFADWDEIWGNPTVYLEWIHRNDDPEKLEGKLLLGGEAAPGWHWGTNFSCEQELSGEEEREYQIAGGLSRVIIDEKFSLGAEAKVQQTDVKDARGEDENSILLGPSMRWQPTERSHIDFTPLIGLNNDSPSAEIFLIMGWEF